MRSETCRTKERRQQNEKSSDTFSGLASLLLRQRRGSFVAGACRHNGAGLDSFGNGHDHRKADDHHNYHNDHDQGDYHHHNNYLNRNDDYYYHDANNNGGDAAASARHYFGGACDYVTNNDGHDHRFKHLGCSRDPEGKAQARRKARAPRCQA